VAPGPGASIDAQRDVGITIDDIVSLLAEWAAAEPSQNSPGEARFRSYKELVRAALAAKRRADARFAVHRMSVGTPPGGIDIQTPVD
jgi:hypothetical protein